MSFILGGAAAAAGTAGLIGLARKRKEQGKGLLARLEHKQDMTNAQREIETDAARELEGMNKRQNNYQGMTTGQIEQRTNQLNQGSGASLANQQMSLAQSGMAGTDPGKLAQAQAVIAAQRGQKEAQNTATVYNASNQLHAQRQAALQQREGQLQGIVAGGLSRELAQGMSPAEKRKLVGQGVSAAGQTAKLLFNGGMNAS